MAEQRHRKIFISYSHKDEKWKDRLILHMRVLQRETAFDIWDDRRILVGDHWYDEIQAALRTSDLALLLISANFLTSDFILREEVPSLLKRHEREGLRLIPIVLEPCAWQKVGWLSRIQLLPRDGRALSQPRRRHEVEQNLTDIATLVFDLVRKPTSDSPTKMPSIASSTSPIPTYKELLTLAKTRQQAGQYDGAQQAFEQAISILTQAVEKSPTVSTLHSSLANACNNLGNLFRRLDRLSDAKQYYHRALDLEEQLSQTEPDNAEYLSDLARTHHNLGTVLLDERRYDPAMSAFQKAVKIRTLLIANTTGHPRRHLFHRELGGSYSFLGNVLGQIESWSDAETAYRKALDYLEPLVTNPPVPIEVRSELGLAYTGLARLLADAPSNRMQEAEDLYQKALKYQLGILEDRPASPDCRHDVAFTLGGIARLSRKQQQLAPSLQDIQQAIDHSLKALDTVSPPVRRWRVDLGRDFRFLLEVLLEMGSFEEARSTTKQIPDALPDDPADCISLAAFLASCVQERVQPGVFDEEKRRALMHHFENCALELLRKGIGKGFADPRLLMTDKRFNELRSRTEFRELISDLQRNSTQ